MIHQFKHEKEDDEQPSGSGRQLDFMRALRSHWKKGVCAAAIVLFLGIPGAWIKGKPKYQAEGVLYISPRTWRNLESDQEQDLQSNSQFREFMQQQAHTINRYDIVQPVVMGNEPGARYFRAPHESDRNATDRLRGALQIAAVPDTYQMTIRLEGNKPDGLADVVNSVMEHYIEVARKEMYYDSDSRLKYLHEERERLQAEIATDTQERDQVAQKLGTTLFNGGVINNYEKLAGENLDALMDARRQRISAEASMGGHPNDPVEQSIQASADDQAQHDQVLISYRSALITRRADLLMRIQGLAPKHAGRIAAEKDIAAIDAELDRATQETKRLAANNLHSIQRGKLAQNSEMERKLSQESASIQAKANDYMRNYQRALGLGEELERLRHRLNMTEDRIGTLQLEVKSPGYVRIFSPAMKPVIPVNGGRKQLLLIIMALAAAMAMAVPVGADFLQPGLRSARELEAALGLPVTGWLPSISGSMAGAEETIRLAVIVRRHLSELPNKALVLCAMKHGSGSSTVALGLGKAMEKLKVRTLVVESNSQTPDERYEQGISRPGLAHWMNGEASLEECIHPGTLELPDRIGVGQGAQEMAMMSGDMVELLVEEARKQYDLILIDAAPLPGSLLTEELIREVDAMMLISRAEVDNRKEIKAVMKQIEYLHPHTLGSVLNNVTARKEQNDSAALLTA